MMFEMLRLFQKGILAFLASSISERRVQKLPKIESDILLRTRLLANKLCSWISKYIFLVVMNLRGATVNLSQARLNILPQFFDRLLLIRATAPW